MKTAKKGYVTLKVCEGAQNKITLGVQVLVGKAFFLSCSMLNLL